MTPINQLLPALAIAESGGNPNALSPKGAAGTYQIMPDTARDPGYGVLPLQGWDGKDPRTAPAEEQKRFANDYLNAMKRINGGSDALSLAAYNAGPGAVQQAGGIPNFKETQDYVAKILPNQQTTTEIVPTSNEMTTPANDWREIPKQTPRAPAAVANPVGSVSAAPQEPQNNAPSAPTSWRELPAPVASKKPEEPSYVQRLGADIQKRGKQGLESQAAYDRGEQGLIETRAQQFAKAGLGTILDVVGTTAGSVYRNLAPDSVQEAVSGAGAYVADSAVGDVAKQYGEDYADWREKNPRAGRNVESLGIGTSVLPIGKAATALKGVAEGGIETATQLGAKVGQKTMALSDKLGESSVPNPRAPKPAPGAEAAAMKVKAGEAFKQADELGETFAPEQLANPLRTEVEALKPKPIGGKVLTTEEKKLVSHLSEYDGLDGVKLSLDEIKRLDEGLGQKITANFLDARTGLPDASGRQLMLLQTKLRNMVDDIPDNAGNDALINARRLWKGQLMLNELDMIAERAALTKNQAEALRNGYKNLYLDKDRIRGWPAEAKEMLRKAADPSAPEAALDVIASRLPAIIMGGTGNFAGAATAQVLGAAARGGKTKAVARKGARVQDSIIKDTMGGLREVKPKPPAPQLLLAAPDKMSKLPMTDRQINIAQKLSAQKKPTGADTSGAPIAPVPTRLLPAPDKVTPLKQQGMIDTEVKIAQKLGAKKTATGADTSGAALTTPKQLMLPAPDKLSKPSKKGMADKQVTVAQKLGAKSFKKPETPAVIKVGSAKDLPKVAAKKLPANAPTFFRGGEIPESGPTFFAHNEQFAKDYTDGRKFGKYTYDKNKVITVLGKEWDKIFTEKEIDMLDSMNQDLFTDTPKWALDKLDKAGYAGFTDNADYTRIQDLAKARVREVTKGDKK